MQNEISAIRAPHNDFVAVFVSRKIADECEEFAFFRAESLAFDSFMSERLRLYAVAASRA